jgi:hypothetical protein
MNGKSKALLGLLLFNGLTAVAGGLALMTDWIPEQASWVRDTDFPSNYFPGVILMGIDRRFRRRARADGGDDLAGSSASAQATHAHPTRTRPRDSGSPARPRPVARRAVTPHR